MASTLEHQQAMDTAHVVILQRNHTYLKEWLQVDPVLDALYQDGVFTQVDPVLDALYQDCVFTQVDPVLDALYQGCVFTQTDYDRCRQAGGEKCEMLLEILKKKGVEGYRTLCTVLDTTQLFIKERLDRTSTEAGLTSVIFVNKIKLEAQHRKEIEEYEKQIALLQSDINDLKQQLEQLRGIQDTLEKTKHKEAKDHISQIKEQGVHIEELQFHLAKSQRDLLKANEKCDRLKKMLEEEKEAYKALVGLPAPRTPDTSGNTGEDMDEARPCIDKKQTCVLSVHGHCDVDKLRLLPCLHAACESCIEKHLNEERRYKLVCPCGQTFTMGETAPDFVRRNEAAYAANSEKEKRCSYLQMTHDTNCVVYCKECNDNLCPNCLNIHNSVRQNSNHTVREISETKLTSIDRLLRQESHCGEHPDNKLQLYDHDCRKPICVVCLHGAHERHMNSDLKHLHDETKNHLLEELGKQESKLQDIRDTLKCAKHHRHELEETNLKLETDIMTIHRNVAVKFLRRQATLLQDIPLNLKVHNEAVQAQIDLANVVEASVVRTIDYIQRALKSTRHWELICLTKTINKMSEENMKAGKFTADSRSTQVRFCFQGKKALEELIDISGCLATTMKPDDIPDKQPTIADLQNQIDIFAQNASKLENRLDETLKVLTCKNTHKPKWW
ncbi:E3 ubiquitin-protein ligase TRIM33-like isoform X3 [Haliotis rufescens]|uniref:E3 ubiquitin-protein ligase TRIM33-like isoform X3 n=1 Tax=Haliotis rufescens TaxID=6454 RepID=UPI00201E852F|nr:E3 ubiquitin-protein ligase TRIM33-like isoform X3 [Haliotis rufescens]